MYFTAQDVLARATPLQRGVLGVPPPGDPYWSTEMIDAVRARFERWGWDMEPYVQAAAAAAAHPGAESAHDTPLARL